MAEKTILKLYANGDLEVVDTTIIFSRVVNDYRFSEDEIVVPTLTELNQGVAPTWVQPTGNPISIFPEGIAITGRLITPNLDGIVTNSLLNYYAAQTLIRGSAWPNSYGNALARATASNVTADGITVSTRLTNNSYVNVPLPTQLINTVSPFTLELKLSVDRLSSDVSLFKGLNNTYPGQGGVLSPDGIALTFPVVTYGGTETFRVTYPLSVNRFYTVCITYDGLNKIDVYIDGVKQGSFTSVGTIYLNGESALKLGENINVTTGYKFIRVYNRALTSAEVLRNYNVGDAFGLGF